MQSLLYDLCFYIEYPHFSLSLNFFFVSCWLPFGLSFLAYFYFYSQIYLGAIIRHLLITNSTWATPLFSPSHHFPPTLLCFSLQTSNLSNPSSTYPTYINHHYSLLSYLFDKDNIISHHKSLKLHPTPYTYKSIGSRYIIYMVMAVFIVYLKQL